MSEECIHFLGHSVCVS